MSVQFPVTSHYCSLPSVFNTKTSHLAVKTVLISTEISRVFVIEESGMHFIFLIFEEKKLQHCAT